MQPRFPTASALLSSLGWALLLLVVGETASGMHANAARFLLERPLPAAIVVLTLTAVLLVFDSFKLTSVAVRPAAALVLIVLGVLNREKLQYLSMPLYTSDLEFADHVWAMLPAFIRAHLGTFVFVVLSSCAFIVMGVVSWRRALVSPRRAPPKVLAAIAIVLLVWLGNPERRIANIRSLGLLNAYWDPIPNARNNGFLLTFALSERIDHRAAPPVPDADVIRSLIESPGGIHSPPTLDLVMVMSESLWDVEALSSVHFSTAPMPTLHQRSGSLISPSLGGGTANVEFEALTGFSTAFLPPNTVPYQHALYRRAPSVMWALKAEGYRTVAVHPYHRWFWRRGQVYEHLGFDRFVALDEMPNAALRGPYTSDDAMVDEVLARLDDTPGPTALFAVSMQNHGPYEPNRYQSQRFELQGNLSDESRAMLQSYVEGVLDTNLSLSRLMEALRKRPTPALLVFFGDHAPALGGKHEVYLEGGAIASGESPLSLTDYVSLHRTPLLIWRSDTNQIFPVPQVSPSLLPSIIFEQLRIEHPFYTRFLSRVRKDFDVVERRARHAADGAWSLVEDAVDEPPILKMFNALQYDLLFGSRSSEALLFPELTPLLDEP